MTGALLLKLARRFLAPPRVIHDLDGTSPYLSRWYLLGARPRMEDGSSPFDHRGDPRPGIIWPSGYGVYLHRFHRGDGDRELHNHPWRWSCSLILAGGYIEERRAGNDVIKRELRPGQFNWIGHSDFHRVELRDGEAWSLFIAGPKVSSWGFWNQETDTVTPWRQFVEAARARRAA